ncbi:MAG TPA: S8 family peptidase, partial [Acidimicrobiales bacterium]|nr:S8 family peptidase [Acidimicrobiales bacterium]
MVAAALGLGVATTPLARADAPPAREVIVISAPGDPAGARGRAHAHGARIDRDLGLINGVAAQATADQVAAMQAEGEQVWPDNPVRLDGTPGAPHAPSGVFPQVTGASPVVAAGGDGSGVTVAVIDTGVDPLPDFGNRLSAGVDLSGEGNALADGYGHGTFVAGLIAGNGASSGGQYVGEAPGANLVAVKVAGASGQTDEASVIAGLGWVLFNRNSRHISVVNLSLGEDASQSTLLDPLDQAVELLVRSGITVVTSAGNYGPANGSIAAPGDDPMAITVGSMDDGGGVDPAQYSIPSFSSVGPTYADGWYKPDLVAPGRSVVSLRAPGSAIDTAYPSAEVGAANFVGSGTSFSAGITSGAVALLLQAHPSWKPSQVKGALLATARPGPVGNPFVDGHGLLAVDAAVASNPVSVSVPGPAQLPPGVTAPAPAPGGGSTPAVPLPYAWWYSTWNP